MKKIIQTALTLLFLLPLGMQAQSVVTKELYEGTQILNSDFEDWSGPDFDNVPVGWHSFESVDGPSLYVSFAKSKEHTAKSDGYDSSASNYCLLLKPRKISFLGNTVLANGTITTGQMYAGAATANDPKNHAQIDMSVTATSNGSPFYAALTGKPTSVALWLKFISNDSENPFAKVSAIITDENYYQDPEDKTYTNVYAKAQQPIESKDGVWQRVEIPFVVQDNNVNPKAILVVISTNATPAGGNIDDRLFVDDLELIYTMQVEIPDCGYGTFTNIVQKNHAVVMPEGLTGYALGKGTGENPFVIKTYKAGDVVPYGTSLLLEGESKSYTFKTTLYESGESPVLDNNFKLVGGSELNNPSEDYKYYFLRSSTEFRQAENGLKIQDKEALLRVKKELAAESYTHVYFTPEKVGDINNDGSQTIADVTALVNRLLGKEQNAFLLPDADVNNDKSTNVADVTELVNILVNE